MDHGSVPAAGRSVILNEAAQLPSIHVSWSAKLVVGICDL